MVASTLWRGDTHQHAQLHHTSRGPGGDLSTADLLGDGDGDGDGMSVSGSSGSRLMRRRGG